MIKSVFFDCDGTLLDTNTLIIKSWQHTYMHYLGHEMPVNHITACFGEPLYDTMAREFPDVDVEEAVKIYRSYQLSVATDYVQLFDGIRELVKGLKERGYQLGIVTSRNTASLMIYLKLFEIEDDFDVIITCDDTNIHKPNPEPLLLAIEKAGTTIEESIYIGDSPYDVKCANSAGVLSVLVGWAITGDANPDSIQPEVANVKPDFKIDKPEDLLKIVENA